MTSRRALLRVLSIVALAALAAAWIVAATRLWRTSVPDGLDPPDLPAREFFSAATIDRADRYESFLDVNWLVASAFQLAVLAWYAARGARFARESAAGPVGTGILLGMLGFAFAWFAQLPFGLVEQWWQHRYDVSEESYVEWFLGNWLSIGGTFLFISLAVAVVMAFARLLRQRWWLAAGPALVLVAAAFAFFQPYLIPDLHPLRDPQLGAQISDLARSQGVAGTTVRVQEVHELTTAPNAEAVGFGPSKRVILWDTLLRDFPSSEVRVVAAHELAHVSRDHILKLLAWFALLGIPIGLAVQAATRRRGGLHEPTAVPLGVFVVVGLLLVLTPVQNAFSRRFEAEADWVALQTTWDPSAAKNAFERFSREALVRPDPPGWARVLREGHPTIMDRIEMVVAWRERPDLRTAPR